eukprot:TRINITY_DN2843_c0_g1_i6.p2 TRINITY_DN2843_c0_g1~~TRINITY_DN2843_c0_g1_i6.p2  ORF type:complete len:263 (+),score=70.36 TRINITY_DN2843_c0_g1_i6:1750-2538(+)
MEERTSVEELAELVKKQRAEIAELKQLLSVNTTLSHSHKEFNTEEPSSSANKNKLSITTLGKELKISEESPNVKREKSKERISTQKHKCKPLSAQKSVVQSVTQNTPQKAKMDSVRDGKKQFGKSGNGWSDAKPVVSGLQKDALLPNKKNNGKTQLPMKSETPSKKSSSKSKRLIEDYISPIKFKSFLALPRTQMASPKQRSTTHSRNHMYSKGESHNPKRPTEAVTLEGNLIEDSDMGVDFTTPHFNPEATFNFKDVLKSI